jgi:hypothetical protein
MHDGGGGGGGFSGGHGGGFSGGHHGGHSSGGHSSGGHHGGHAGGGHHRGHAGGQSDLNQGSTDMVDLAGREGYPRRRRASVVARGFMLAVFAIVFIVIAGSILASLAGGH